MSVNDSMYTSNFAQPVTVVNPTQQAMRLPRNSPAATGRALPRLAAGIDLSTDQLLQMAMASYIPGTIGETLARRALALFHERDGQHVTGVCSECGELAAFEAWAQEAVRRL